MARLVRDYDWSKTPLGPMERWPQSLRTAASICLGSRFPMMLWWGSDLIFIYNDGYARMLGLRHPDALGRSGRDVWPEVWPVIAPQVEAVMCRGESTWNERVHLVVERNGVPENAWFTFSFSPIHDESGRIAGLFNACREDTQQVRAEMAQREGDARLQALAAVSGTVHYRMNADWSELQPLNGKGLILSNDASIRNWMERNVPASEHAAILERIRHCIETREHFDMEHRVYRPDGFIGWTRSRAVPVLNEAGGIVEWVGAAEDVTGRRMAEAALRQSEERYRRLVETAHEGIWTIDAEGRTTYVNRRMADLLGYSPQEMFGRVHTDFMWEQDRPKGDVDMELRRQGTAQVWDQRYRRKDGSELWTVASCTSLYDDKGNFAGALGMFTDITARKRAEGRTRLLVALDDAVRSLADPEQITAAAARLLGEHLGADRCAYADVEPDQDTFNLIGDYTRQGVPSIIGRYRFADFGAEVLRLLREDKPYVVEDIDTHQPPVGDLTYYRQTMIRAVICVPLHKAGSFVAAMAVHQRVPRLWTADEIELVQAVAARCWESIERVRVMRALRQSEGRFRELADAMPQMVWVTRPDGYHEYFNRRWYEFTGVPEGSTDGEGWNGLFHPEDQPMAWERWRHSLATGELYEIEYRLRHRSGEYRWTLGRALPIRNESGGIERWLGTCTDIDAMKRLTAEREHLLERERIARAEAEAANRAKDKFLAVLSHELRTPLSPVVMTIPSLEIDPEMPFKFREDLAMVRRNIDLEVKLIDDLLDLSRVTSGKLRLQMQPVHAHELLLHVLRSSGSEASGKRLIVRHELNAANDHLSADPARLQQVFWNLLRNAVKFTPDGGEVVVRTWNAAAGSNGGAGGGADSGQLLVEVRDSGVGIEPQVLHRIFDAFEQGDARMTRQFGGLGLGLAIAKAVVEMHGGSISAASGGRNQGAAFTVRLNTVSIGAATTPAARGDAGSGGQRDAARPRVLLVEDHPDTARTLARLLSISGYEVKTAHSVASALRLAASDPFDLLVSDIGLPDATGYDLMAQIRERYGIKGIALSGYGMEEDMKKSRDAGFVDHVVKPVNVDQLEAVIRRVLHTIRPN